MSRTVILELNSLIEFPTDFSFGRYWEGEPELVKRLKDKGYTPVSKFYSTEKDSFGPLSRGIHCVNAQGEKFLIMYG